MAKQKLTFLQRALRIEELAMQIHTICEDDEKKPKDYTLKEILNEAYYVLEKLQSDLQDDSYDADKKYNRNQIAKLKRFINDFE
jgi:hypothetical protein